MVLVGCCVLLLLAFLAHGRMLIAEHARVCQSMAAMVKQYELTDLCIFTEARYTRHPSMADLGTACQDHPLSLEHFPSGSLVGPPEHLRRYGRTYGMD